GRGRRGGPDALRLRARDAGAAAARGARRVRRAAPARARRDARGARRGAARGGLPLEPRDEALATESRRGANKKRTAYGPPPFRGGRTRRAARFVCQRAARLRRLSISRSKPASVPCRRITRWNDVA